MSANPYTGPTSTEECPPFLCCLEECIRDRLKLGGARKGICKGKEQIKCKLGSSRTTRMKKKLGTCGTIEDRTIELVLHITAKQCTDGSKCRTLYLQEDIETAFNEDTSFCGLASGTYSLVDSDIIYENKSDRTIVRQLVYSIPYKVRVRNS
jgi:hypothetical protein